MKTIYLIAFVSFFFLQENLIIAQDEGLFQVEVSSDTVLLGNYFSLKFSIENVEGEFVPPSFEGFQIISGPNMSSQYSMINGVVTQKSSYSYHLLPLEEGSFEIGSARLKKKNDEISLDPITITVMPNPDGLIENPGSSLFFRNRPMTEDTLSEEQKKLQAKLKKGKKYKI